MEVFLKAHFAHVISSKDKPLDACLGTQNVVLQ